MDQDVKSNADTLNILTFPSKLLVYIFSFLTNIRDVAKLRYVSRRFRSICETRSLWREFVWLPGLDVREECCVKSLLKSFGLYIKRLIFPNHLLPSKLETMARRCVNAVELGIPTSNLNCDHLENVLGCMQKLQSLDIPWTSEIHPLLVLCYSRGLKELTTMIRVKDQLQRSQFKLSLTSWLDKWVLKGFHPQILKVVVGRDIPLTKLVEHWLQLNRHSPTGHTGCLKVFRSLKVPMDPCFPTLPDFQLQFGEWCTLPFVKPSKCGLLGLEDYNILLTDSTYSGEVLRKAIISRFRNDIELNHFSTDIAGLGLITHFDASGCGSLHPGHLEQLAMAFPKLRQLNLQGNKSCLNTLQGLHVLVSRCKNLQGINLLNISVLSIESHIELWKILVDMSLTHLAIDLCVLLPLEKDDQAEPEFISSFQECLNLKALEFHKEDSCHICHECSHQCNVIFSTDSHILSILANFPSLTRCFVGNLTYDVYVIINSFSMLKYFTHFSNDIIFPWRLAIQNCNLEQICIKPDVLIPNIFMQSVSAHGQVDWYMLFCVCPD